MGTIYFIRHAQKETGEFYDPLSGRHDQPISAAAQAEAEHLMPFFKGKSIAAIYFCEYRRTWQTIQPVAQMLGITPVIDPRLNEIDNGQVGMLRNEEFQRSFPETWNAYVSRAVDFRFPGGETGTEAQARVIDFLAKKQATHSNEDIIANSHDGLMRLMMCYLVDLPLYRRSFFQVDTCGMIEIAYQPEYQAWKVVRCNQVW